MAEIELTHKKLCEIGAKFLKRPYSSNGHGCHFTIIEAACYGENPDVFGIRHGCDWAREGHRPDQAYMQGWDVGTFVLEAKTSRSDFLKDREKPHRINPDKGMGKWRYYICPVGLISKNELPEKWGLIYVNKQGHCSIVAGAMAIEKKKGPYGAYRSRDELKDSFKEHAFVETQRNVQNEFNLLAMAMARIGDAEQLLYMQRSYLRLSTQVQEMQSKIRSLESENARLRYRLKPEKDKTELPDLF